MIGTHDPLSRLVLHIALLIWKSCLESIYWVIFMNFKFHDLSTFCLLDNWSQKWVKLILYLVTCCACENEVMHITAMTCIHIVEAKYQITVQVHFQDNIPQSLTFRNRILIFHMLFHDGRYLIMCGKCTIFRYFRQFTFMWKSSFAIFQSLLLQEDVVNFDRCLSMSMIFFSHEDWICALSDHKRQILGTRKTDHCLRWNHHQLHNNFFFEKKLYESFSSWKC